MKVVLTKPYLPVHQRTIVTFPIGLLYLASYLKAEPDVAVRICDPDIFEKDRDAFLDTIVSEAPDIIGISVFSHVLEPAIKMIDDLRKLLPGATIIIGGSHVNAVREKVFKQLDNIDYAFYGEGEKGLRAFCRAKLTSPDSIDYSAIPGLLYRTGDSIASVPNTFSDNVDEFDPVDFSLIDVPYYMRNGSPMGLFHRGKNVAQLITTRGCPFSCTFCASPLNMGKKVRKRSTEFILKEIETLVGLGADEIHIMDDNFTFDRNHVIKLCEGIVERNLQVDYCMPNGVRLDKLDAEMLAAMKRAGWYHLGFGVEVGSDEALKLIRKGITMDKIKEKVALVKNAGLDTTGFFILGLPHDTLKTMTALAKVPDQLGIDLASFGNFTPLPGTQIFNELVQRGEISDDYQPSFASGRVTYAPPGVTFEQLAKIQRNIILGYWLHPRRVSFILKRLAFRDIPYLMRRLYQIVARPDTQ